MKNKNTLLDTSAFFFDGDSFRPNARFLKFLFTTTSEPSLGITEEQRIQALATFLSVADENMLADLFRAATSSDGYCYMPAYTKGFSMLERSALERKAISIEELNRTYKRTGVYNITLNSEGKFVDMEKGENLDDLIQAYSLMKFGSVAHINFFARKIADKFLRELDQNANGILESFEWIAENNENVALFVPGSRNVHSSSNFVLERATDIINISLAQADLPTIIKVRLPRLASNTANYAQLSAEERARRATSTKTQLPGPDFFQNPMHIIFGDDVRITGATVDRVRESVIANGALTFREMYAFIVDPLLAHSTPQVEHKLNTALIDGTLNQDIAYILNQPGFRPVQRLVRLVLDPSNRSGLEAFLNDGVCKAAIADLFIATTGNDYLKNEKYRESGQILAKVAEERNVFDAPLQRLKNHHQ